jgi:glutamyl-tRNA reductase
MIPDHNRSKRESQAESAALPVLIGLDHRTAPLEVRERLSVEGVELVALLRSLHQEPLTELAIVSTCHRLEVYAITVNGEHAERLIVERLALPMGVTPEALMGSLYRMRGAEASRHLLRVAAGLESLVVGEAQIQGQVADALQTARTAQTCGPKLSRLFAAALHAGKRARSETGIGRQALSVSHAAARLVARDLESLVGKRVAVVGAGEMAALALQALRAQGASDICVVSRTYERASDLARRYSAAALPWSQRWNALSDARAVVVATRAPHVLLRAEDFAPGDSQRMSAQPVIVVDISVPRAVDPAMRGLSGLRLYDIDALQAIVADDQQVRREDISRVERIVEEELASHLAWARSQRVVPAIAALRAQAAAVAQAEIERALRRAPELEPREQEILREMAHRIVAKLLHSPTITLKERAARSEHRDYLHATWKLFGLDEDGATSTNGSDDD